MKTKGNSFANVIKNSSIYTVTSVLQKAIGFLLLPLKVC